MGTPLRLLVVTPLLLRVNYSLPNLGSVGSGKSLLVSPAQSFFVPSPAGLISRDCGCVQPRSYLQPGGLGRCIFVPPVTGGPVIPSGTGFPTSSPSSTVGAAVEVF
jgi:hypothetical protein